MTRSWPLTLRGIGTLVLAVACFATANEFGLVQLVAFGMLLLALLAASALSLQLAKRTATVTRTLSPEVAAVGGALAVTVHVAVRSALPSAPGAWSERVEAGLTGRPRGEFPAIESSLRGGERTVELRYDLVAARRGVHTVGPLQLTATDPFGLVRRAASAGGSTQVVVAPAIIDLPPLIAARGETGGARRSTGSQPGQGADDLIARPYAPGDSRRRIHWRSTAHRDELMVRQEEQESAPDALVALDLGVARWSPEAMDAPGADPAFEAALSAAVSAVARLVHDGYRVSVIDTDGSSLCEPIEGGDGPAVDTLTAQVATLVARHDDHLPHLGAQLGATVAGPLVLVAGRVEPGDVDALSALPAHCSLPVLLGAALTGDAAERLAATGWRVGEIGPGHDLGRAWVAASDAQVRDVVR